MKLCEIFFYIQDHVTYVYSLTQASFGFAEILGPSVGGFLFEETYNSFYKSNRVHVLRTILVKT